MLQLNSIGKFENLLVALNKHIIMTIGCWVSQPGTSRLAGLIGILQRKQRNVFYGTWNIPCSMFMEYSMNYGRKRISWKR